MHELPSDLAKLANRSLANSNRWFGENGTNLNTQVLGLVSEVGDVADTLQAINMGTLDFKHATTRYKFGMDLAGAFVYFLNICSLTHMDPAKLFEMREVDSNKKNAFKQEVERVTEFMDGVKIVRPD